MRLFFFMICSFVFVFKAVAMPETMAHFQKAQAHFTDGELSEAKSSYLKTIEGFASSAGTYEKRLVQFSYLRLAQMETDRDMRESYFQKALALKVQMDEEMALLPADLIEEYQAQKLQPTSQVTLSELLPDQKGTAPTIESSMRAMPSSDKPRAFYQKPIFWVGAAVVAGGLALALQKRDKPPAVVQPTRTSGF